ncbi:MAG TPA: hypothetical protein VM778_03290 [Gemmatimonadota bacterium]|nr:hypothetical protein [Gemmatimonadota bacterium]
MNSWSRIRALWGQRHDVAAGLVDASLASLATFVVGVYAVRALDPAVLGAYALVYQAIFLVGIVPAQLVFLPVEIAVIARPLASRTRYLARSIRVGLPIALAAGLATVIWIPVAPAGVPDSVVWPLTASGIAAAALSPVQDHARRILHAGGRSWTAAIVSTVQLGTVVAALAVFSARGVDAAWLPFGALALANLASLLVAAAGAHLRTERDPVGLDLRFAQLALGGRWLLGGGLLSPASGFAAAAVVSQLAGAAALGYAEAARVVAQPVWVLAVGLSSVFGPRSMEAALHRRRWKALGLRRIYIFSVLVVGAINVAWLGAAWALNPLAWLMPAAYVVPGLVAASIAAQSLGATMFPYRSELLGGRRESSFTRVEGIGAVARVAASVSALSIHAFAIPLGNLVVAVVRWIGFRNALERMYRTPAPTAATPVVAD